jgi:hypothetical protein
MESRSPFVPLHWFANLKGSNNFQKVFGPRECSIGGEDRKFNAMKERSAVRMEKEARRKEKFKENLKIEEKEQKGSWARLEQLCGLETEVVYFKIRQIIVTKLYLSHIPHSMPCRRST